MKILKIRLTNFNSVKAAMGLTNLELDFSNIDKPIIQIFGRNRCGKSVLISELNPFSSINYDGDERNELPSIIKGEQGEKNIVYDVNGVIYNITHIYKPTSKSHNIYSSITENGVELNPSGGVNTFNVILEKIFGINKHIFQFIINSTQLTSFAKLSSTQRKNRLNKSLGIDIYDKIHKLSTDDYRYTNKIIQSLNSTKEFLISKYGTYENLVNQLNSTREEFNQVNTQISNVNSYMNKMSGVISSLTNQNIESELFEIDKQIQEYDSIVETIGEYNGLEYDKMVNEQIRLNSSISELKSQRMILLKDLDNLYDNISNVQNTKKNNQRMIDDYQNMVKLVDKITTQIKNISIDVPTSSSSERYRALLSHAQTINSICKEIVITLNKNHLDLFTQMIEKRIDISVYLARVSTSIMETEKEKVVLSKMHQLMQSANGTFPDENNCLNHSCVYKNAYDILDAYFKSEQSTTNDQLTAFDISSMEQAYKNIQTIQRLLSIDVPDELVDLFNITTIMHNLSNNKFGIDISYITLLMEEAAKVEQRNTLIKQLNDANITLNNMKQINDITDYDESLKELNDNILVIKSQVSSLDNQITDTQNILNSMDSKRIKLSSIQNINIKDLRKRQIKLRKLVDELNTSKANYSVSLTQLNELTFKINTLQSTLSLLEKDNSQFLSTEQDISNQMASDKTYKIISEATSSTKGKPVLAIRETVESALSLTNRLLNIMYDSEIEMLSPIINESSFTLPFRVGANINRDIRYGSQSEQSLLSLAFAMSIAAYLTQYNIFLNDEIDAPLDTIMVSSYLTMLFEIMSTFKMEQMFVISHHISENSNPQYVHELNLSYEIDRQKG